MPRSSVVEQLVEGTQTGLREMPSNAAWLLSRVLHPAGSVGTAAGSAAAGARDRGRKMKAVVADFTPIGEDSIDVRMKRARDAAERATEAEQRALEAAQEADELSKHVDEVSEGGQGRMIEVERELAQRVKQRVAEAERAAEQFVEEQRRAAEADAEDERRAAQAEVEAEIEEAQHDAEVAREETEKLVAEATEQLNTARQLAEEAAEAARAAAEGAQERARELAAEAEQHASEAQARVTAAEQVRERSTATATETARGLEEHATNGGLESYNKPELVELAATIGIEGRTNMTKAELVDAISKASRTRR
jgi:colicin import membrane protein